MKKKKGGGGVWTFKNFNSCTPKNTQLFITLFLDFN